MVGVVASGPDLAHILDRVVDLLTRATDCHACFVYLHEGDRLELGAASPVYTHLVGKISFGIDQGLAGWSVRNGEAAFIRDEAITDPRTHYVPELEEERFQSMVAVPIPARDGAAMGAIVLHTEAPREFDERIINVISRAAALVSGAIENARLFEDAQARVEALTRLAAFGRDVAAVADRRTLLEVTASGIREVIDAELAITYGADGPGGILRRAAMAPALDTIGDGEGTVLEEALASGEFDPAMEDRIVAALGLGDPRVILDAVDLSTAQDRIGAIVVGSRREWPQTSRELLRAAAQQVALAAEKIALIEHLTQENLARDLFDALADGDLNVAAERLRASGLPGGAPCFVIEARPLGQSGSSGSQPVPAELERGVRSAVPKAFCDLSSGTLRALVPVACNGVDAVMPSIQALDRSGVLDGMAIGVSEARTGVKEMATALREARDAVTVADRLGQAGKVLLYPDAGAYRYLIDVLDEGGPDDHLRAAMDKLIAYDRERGSQLMHTLDEYLSSGRIVASTSRQLFVHVNTLRQRLERIHELTGVQVNDEDLLTLQLAVKLGRVRAVRR
ncbi:MAG: helix-turn-helix domain-containing protein [Solirubrobacterales bacterium]